MIFSVDSPVPEVVSIIIPVLNAAEHLDRLFSSFFEVNTHSGIEFIIMDHGSTDNTAQVVASYANRAFIRRITRSKDYTFAHSCNLGASRAEHPCLLFLRSDIVFTSDVLPPALEILEKDHAIGVVGPGLEKHALSLSQGVEPGNRNLGIGFVWNQEQGCFQPEQIPSPDVSGNRGAIHGYCSAITGAFMLCRKTDFEQLGGFSTQYEHGLEDIDFCLRLGRDLHKKCFCMAEPGLQRQPSPGNSSPEGYDAFSRDVLQLNKKYTRELFRHHLEAHSFESDPALDHEENVGIFNVHTVRSDEDLLRRNKWRSLRSGYAHPYFDEPDLSGQPPIGWVQPHLNMCGGIRRAIEMSNRLSEWGADFYLITPQGIKTDWLPIKSQVISLESAIKKDFGSVIVSDPDCIHMFQKIPKKEGLFYHLSAYMLYRPQNEALYLYYQLAGSYPNFCNSKWTAQHLDSYCGLQSRGIVPGGVDKVQFRPYLMRKVYDTCFFGARNRRLKATRELQETLSGLSQLLLAEHCLPQNLLAPAVSSSRIFVSGSYYEGFNLCPLEAMACGVPVVMTDCGGSREYAFHEENALVVPNKDFSALREQVHRLLKDQGLRLRLIENGMETAWRFDWDSIALKLAGILAGRSEHNWLPAEEGFSGQKSAPGPGSLKAEEAVYRHSASTLNTAPKSPPSVCQFTPARPLNPFFHIIGNCLVESGVHFFFSTDQKYCLDLAREKRPGRIFNFHQLEPYYHPRSGDSAEARKRAENLLDFLGRLKEMNAFLVLTKHDPRPYGRCFEDVDEYVEDWALQNFDHFIVLARGAADLLREHLPASKISVLPHPEYRSYYGPPVSVAAARTRHAVPRDRFVFGYIGGIKPYKGLELIIEAFKQFSSFPEGDKAFLLLAGNPGPGPYEYLRSLQLNLPPNAMLVPEIIQEKDVASWMATLDASVFAFREIWVSGSVILSLSYQKPVIVPEVGFLDEYVKHGKNGFFYRHGCKDSLALAMREIMRCPDYVSFERNCEMFVKEHDLKSVADSYLKTYFSLV